MVLNKPSGRLLDMGALPSMILEVADHRRPRTPKLTFGALVTEGGVERWELVRL